MLDSYIILNKSSKNILKIYYYSLISLLSLLIYIILNINYIYYLKYNGNIIKDDNKYLIKIDLPLNSINVITSNNKLILKNKTYNYQVKKIIINNKYTNILLSINKKDYNYKTKKIIIKIKEENYNLIKHIKNKGGIK